MRKLPFIASLAALAIVAGCNPPSGGYYDESGNYVQYTRYNKQSRQYEPVPAGSSDPRFDESRPTRTKVYERRGYYDYQGRYYQHYNTLGVPSDMLPPSGMCRVWLPSRAAQYQPAVESCEGIRQRVPEGAYVIYGG
jgi:hypothetical protein